MIERAVQRTVRPHSAAQFLFEVFLFIGINIAGFRYLLNIPFKDLQRPAGPTLSLT